jgi:hypothetical protein
MRLFPACEFPLLGDAEAIDMVKQAISARQPFSLIRLGDGEAVVLSFDDDIWLQDLDYLHGHWGAERVTLGAVSEVKEGLEEAITGANMVGIRTDILNSSLPADLLDRTGPEIKDYVTSAFELRQQEIASLTGIGARRLAMLHRVLSRTDWSENQMFCSAWIHWELLATGALDEILSAVPEVVLVTSRPELEEMVKHRFDVPTKAVIVPDKFVLAPESGRHVPDRFRDIRSDLRFQAGTLALVGAGIPGKVYCQWLKESGCVAIDVGSVFDAWVGRASRPRVLESRFGVAGGDRVPSDLLLRAPGSTDRRLIPRWKTSGVPD